MIFVNYYRHFSLNQATLHIVPAAWVPELAPKYKMMIVIGRQPGPVEEVKEGKT